MPITRRRRANPPDQPENNHHNTAADQIEGIVEQPLHAEPASTPATNEVVEQPELPAGDTSHKVAGNAADEGISTAGKTQQPEANQVPQPNGNGDRISPDYTPTIEGGRRTARGELFRRPPQVPPPPVPAPFTTSAPLQAPTHEITLPLGNLLHLAYNPGYTGAEEARSVLLHGLADETKAGGRARCWNCGSLAIAYDCWNTRDARETREVRERRERDARGRSFGDVGVAFCEICGVWSVM